MKASVLFGTGWEDDSLEVLWRDTGRAFCKLRRDDGRGEAHAFIPIAPGSDRSTLDSVNRLGQLHGRGLIHKDLTPAHVLVDPAADRARLTGFGIASRLWRERQPPDAPELIAGTLASPRPLSAERPPRRVGCVHASSWGTCVAVRAGSRRRFWTRVDTNGAPAPSSALFQGGICPVQRGGRESHTWDFRNSAMLFGFESLG